MTEIASTEGPQIIAETLLYSTYRRYTWRQTRNESKLNLSKLRFLKIGSVWLNKYTYIWHQIRSESLLMMKTMAKQSH